MLSVSCWLAWLIVRLTKSNCRRRHQHVGRLQEPEGCSFVLPAKLPHNTKWKEGERESERDGVSEWERERERAGENIGVVLVAKLRFTSQQSFRMPVCDEGYAGLNSQYFFAPLVPYWVANNGADPPHPAAYWLMLRRSATAETRPHCLSSLLPSPQTVLTLHFSDGWEKEEKRRAKVLKRHILFFFSFWPKKERKEK